MTKWYTLNDRQTVPVASLEEWARQMATVDRHVASDEIGDVSISTVFLGLDHRHFGDGPPLLFETMIFGGEHNEYQTRASTWDEAEQQHAEALTLVRKSMN